MGEQQGKQLADKQIPRTPVKTEAPQGMQRHTNAKNRTAHGADGGKKCKPEMFARQTELDMASISRILPIAAASLRSWE